MAASPADLRSAFERRVAPGRALAADADRISAAGRDMAARFHGGGKLIVFGNGGAAADAGHVGVEFVHPVLVGKRALPAISLAGDAARLTAISARQGFDEVYAEQVRLLAAPGDIALGFSWDGRCPGVLRGLRAARECGALTVALVGGDGGPIGRDGADGGGGGGVDHVLTARSGDPCVVKEIHVTMYHILWELVHVFLARPCGPGAGPEAAR